MNEPHKDVIQFYAKKYNFHKLLTTMLSLKNNDWEKFIIDNPIVQSVVFAKYVRNRSQEMKDMMETIKKEYGELTPLIIKHFDSLEKSILSTSAREKRRRTTLPSSTRGRMGSAQCSVCAGTGYLTCSSCAGYGYHTSSYTRTTWDDNIEYINESIPCSSCVGGKQTCSKCGGSGMVLE